jgi:hypothetical protein
MSHILATRYKIDEDFGTQSALEELEKLEHDIKEKQVAINRKEHEKTEKKETDELKKDLGSLKDKFKQSLKEKKIKIGTDLFNR